MKKLIYPTSFLYFLVVFCSFMDSNASMCSSSSISSSPSSATSTVNLNPTSTEMCKRRAAAYPDLVKEVTALVQETARKFALETPVYLELNNSTKAPNSAKPCFLSVQYKNNELRYTLHIYPKLFRSSSLAIQKFLIGRLIAQIRYYPETLKPLTINRAHLSTIMVSGSCQSLETIHTQIEDSTLMNADQLNSPEEMLMHIAKTFVTSLAKGIWSEVQTVAQKKILDIKNLTLKLDATSCDISDEHHKGALEYLEHHKKEEAAWSKTYLWLQRYLLGYATADERLRELPENKTA